MEVITRYILRYYILHKIVGPNVTVLEKDAIEDLLMISADKNVQKCHLIITNINVDYKEPVVITGIKLDI